MSTIASAEDLLPRADISGAITATIMTNLNGEKVCTLAPSIHMPAVENHLHDMAASIQLNSWSCYIANI